MRRPFGNGATEVRPNIEGRSAKGQSNIFQYKKPNALPYPKGCDRAFDSKGHAAGSLIKQPIDGVDDLYPLIVAESKAVKRDYRFRVIVGYALERRHFSFKGGLLGH